MICNSEKCTASKDNNKLLSCTVCERVFHLMCCGISGKCLNSVNNNNGLLFLCFNCRGANAGVIKAALNGSAEVCSELRELQLKVDKYDKILSASSFLLIRLMKVNPLHVSGINL